MDHGPPGGYYPDAKRQRTAKPDHAFSKQQSGYEFQQHKMNAAVAAQGGRQKQPASKVAIRRAGGKTWRDDTLEQWPEGDFRLFVGNIGNEVTDELLSHSSLAASCGVFTLSMRLVSNTRCRGSFLF